MRAIPNRDRTTNISLRRIELGRASDASDEVVTEEPLEIRVYHTGSDGRKARENVTVTMRTPGNDFELAAGLLHSEGIISSGDDIEKIDYGVDADEQQRYNIVNVHLTPNVKFKTENISRNFYSSSACGVCGKASLDALHMKGFAAINSEGCVRSDLVRELPDRLKKAQNVFNKTGGLHAAGLFDWNGRLLILREDVGRHNALDKLIGAWLLGERVTPGECICIVSGRLGFELVQKALVAGIPVMVAVGAPSSLAIELGKEFNMTVIGFVRGNAFNVYSGSQRVLIKEPSSVASVKA